MSISAPVAAKAKSSVGYPAVGTSFNRLSAEGFSSPMSRRQQDARFTMPSKVSASNQIKFANLLPPMFICVIIATVWSIYWGLHLLPLLQVTVPPHLRRQKDAAEGLFDLVVSQTVIGMMLFCYGRATLTSPGTVPDALAWRLVGGGQEAVGRLSRPLTREVKLTGERRYCKWCLRYKPDRCHHCRVCGMCILKMDHHCPWIMNCVGFRNHKYFFLLVFYAVLSCMYVGGTLLHSVHRSLQEEMSIYNRFFLVLGLVLSVIVGSLMTLFLAFHTYLMLVGMTTIEFCEKNTLASAGLQTKRRSYDFGFSRNFTAVFGTRPLLWLLPVSPPEGDGTSFAVVGEMVGDGEVDPEWTSIRGPLMRK